MFRFSSRPAVGATVVTLALELALATTGCSLMFSHGPPDNHAQLDSFTCTEAKTAPIIDAVAAALQLVTVADIASNPGSYDTPEISSDAQMAITVGMLAVYGASAVVGFNKSKACRAARQQLTERLARLRDTTTDSAVPDY